MTASKENQYVIWTAGGVTHKINIGNMTAKEACKLIKKSCFDLCVPRDVLYGKEGKAE